MLVTIAHDLKCCERAGVMWLQLLELFAGFLVEEAAS